MSMSIASITFEVDTVFKGFKVNAEVICDVPWDYSEDEIHVNHLTIRAHNCGTEFCKSFPNEYDIAESWLICDSSVDFQIRNFERPDIEELVVDFLRCWLLGAAPFAMEHGWWCSADRAKIFA